MKFCLKEKSKYSKFPVYEPSSSELSKVAIHACCMPAVVLFSCTFQGFPGGASGKEPACQCRRHKRCWFNHWAGKILCSRAWQPTPVFLPGESHGQRSLEGYNPLDHTQRVRHDWSNWACIYHTTIYKYIQANRSKLTSQLAILIARTSHKGRPLLYTPEDLKYGGPVNGVWWLNMGGSGGQMMCVEIQLPLTSCVTSDILLFSESQFPHLQNNNVLHSTS